jgi:hypothetical protein
MGRSLSRERMRRLQYFLARQGLITIIIGIFLCVGLGAAEAQRRGRRRKIIRLEAIKVEGRIQKPQAFYVLQRSSLNFEGLELKQSFIPKIVKSIEKEPF